MRRALAAALAPLTTLPGVTARVATAGVDFAAVGFDERRYSVQVIAGAAETEESEQLLDELVARTGHRSVKALLEANPKLGGRVADITVARCSGAQLFKTGDRDAIGATWTVHTKEDV